MKLFNPALGAKARAVVRILAAVVVVLTSPAVADLQFSWVASVLAVVNAVIAFLTTFTDVGNEKG